MLRRLLAATALGVAATAVAVLPSAPAQALYSCPANYQCIHTWYVDQAHTIWNGSYSINCEGTSLRLGTQSGFLVFSQELCNEPPPIEY